MRFNGTMNNTVWLAQGKASHDDTRQRALQQTVWHSTMIVMTRNNCVQLMRTGPTTISDIFQRSALGRTQDFLQTVRGIFALSN